MSWIAPLDVIIPKFVNSLPSDGQQRRILFHDRFGPPDSILTLLGIDFAVYLCRSPSASTAGTQLITNGPQTNPGDVSPSWSAQRNVTESEQYDRLLTGNTALRQPRMRKECGPITDPQLHQQCLDSFARY